ncbi:MAG TPA: hypothetical protein VE981_08840 [Planctomycetota bacterium]|nr:hypothetical protein [Planctomycetota bacterium]
MAADRKPKEGSSMTVIAVSVLLALGAGGVVWYFQDQAVKSENLLLRTKDEYRQMEKMKRPVEEYLRSRPKGPPVKEEAGDMLTFLDRKAREAQIPPGVFTIAKNANATVGTWVESSYTVTLQSDKKDVPVKRVPVVDFLGRVERERKSAKSKSIQLTFAGDDLKNAIITFSQFQPK